MKPVFQKTTVLMALAVSLLLGLPTVVKAQDPAASPTPMDERARQRAEREAKKAAEKEEKELRATAEKERKEAEAAAKERDKAAARRAAEEKKSQQAGTETKGAQATEKPALSPDALTRDQVRMQEAEKRARAEAEKARLREEERTRAQEAKDVERRRKDEERAQREAAKAREAEDRARAAALKREQGESDKAARRAHETGAETAPSDNPPAQAAPAATPLPQAATSSSGEPVSKDAEKRRKELVKQIEKARAERDRLTREAEDAERIAKAARTAANEGQRSYEALATGLDVEDVTLPTPAAPVEAQPKRNRFTTKADEKQAAAAKSAPQAAPDPLRIALDLKSPDAETREKTAFALATLGPDAQPATRALMAALTDANAAVRVAAAQALGRIGTGAGAALTPLTAALTDPDPAVRNAAQAALLAIQGR